MQQSPYGNQTIPMTLTQWIKKLFGIDEDDNNLLFLFLFLSLLDSGTDDPETLELLKYLEYLEPEFERIFERRFSFIKLPFPPHYLFQRVMHRLAQRKTYIRANDIDDMQSRLRVYEVELRNIRTKLASNNIDKELSNAKVLISSLDSKLAELTWEISTGTNLAEMRIHRSIPVRVYLTDANISLELGDNVLNAIFDALSEIGIERSIELPDEFGSWWKTAWGTTKEALTQDEVLERIEKLEYAAQLKIIDKPQSEITKAHAEAASKMIKSLDGVPTASVQVGSLLIVKTTQKRGDVKVVIRTLTASELISIEKNKSILKTPACN